MTAFFCDLDNTLIYSSRHEIGSRKVCVEYYQGKPLSYMTPLSIRLLKQLCQRIEFVPTTTRTPEQYTRIHLSETPGYALVCNGGMLLRNGIIDIDWYEQSLSLIKPCLPELLQAQVLLQMDPCRSFEVRFLHRLFLFTKSSNPDKTRAFLSSRFKTKQVELYSQGDKIYLLPKPLTKQAAGIRLQNMLGISFSFSAGDSPMDFGMLCSANRAFAPASLTLPSPSGSIVPIAASVFSDAFLRLILEDLSAQSGSVH